MSVYYDYYLGCINDDKKIVPIGPFDADGKIYPAYSTLGGLSEHLRDDFNTMQVSQFSDELKKVFNLNPDGEYMPDMMYLKLSDLPTGSFIKSGYFLISDIAEYEKTHNAGELFYDSMSPAVYAKVMENEIKFKGIRIGPDEHPIRDYAYYAYSDYECREYEAFMLRTAFAAYDSVHGLINGREPTYAAILRIS